MTNVCHIEDIANDRCKGVVVEGSSYFIVKKEGKVFAYANRCPHLGIELNWQEDQFLDADATLIQCTSHGALFLIDSGKCISGPCLGQSLTAIPCQIENGLIHLSPTI